MSNRRFRVALSFAGEKRHFVREVAHILATRFGEAAILYDEFHTAESVRYDTGIYLARLYSEQSDLIVPILCPKYDAKRWTGWEWVHIYGLLTKEEGYRVMPCRFEYAEVEGLGPAASFLELDKLSPREASTRILERLARNEEKPKDYYSKPCGREIPNNLPRPQAFFGREEELKTIAGALSREGRGWGALIDGPGGIGKTALAIRAAELVPCERFKRTIFLSAKQTELTADGERSLGPRVLKTCLEMLNGIARELRQPDLLNPPEAERAETVLRALRELDVLLVLDNLETLLEPDREELFAFLNHLPQGCSAIVTSRGRADAGAFSVRLDRLDWGSARALLYDLEKVAIRLRETSEEDLHSLYDQTDGNPLLIRWVVGQLGYGRYRTVFVSLAHLRNAPIKESPLNFVFRDLVDFLTERHVTILAVLSFFPQGIALKNIIDLDPLRSLSEGDLDSVLRELSNRSLIVPKKGEGAFALVPLVADFLRRQCPSAIRDVGDAIAKRADWIIQDNGWQKNDRFKELEDQWPSLAAAFPLLLLGPNDRLQRVCAGLARFAVTMGYWDEALSLCKHAEGLAVRYGDLKEAGWRAYQAGYIYFRREQQPELDVCVANAARCWGEPDTMQRERNAAIRLRGLSHWLGRRYQAAIKDFETAFIQDQALNPLSRDVEKNLRNLSEVYRALGDVAAAKRFGDEADSVTAALGAGEAEAYRTHHQGIWHEGLHQWMAAETFFRQALESSEKVGRKDLIASNSHHLACVLVHQGKCLSAKPHAELAVELYQKFERSPKLKRALETLQECKGGMELNGPPFVE
jgi:tetratricopeptide (TPR) repeat protein